MSEIGQIWLIVLYGAMVYRISSRYIQLFSSSHLCCPSGVVVETTFLLRESNMISSWSFYAELSVEFYVFEKSSELYRHTFFLFFFFFRQKKRSRQDSNQQSLPPEGSALSIVGSCWTIATRPVIVEYSMKSDFSPKYKAKKINKVWRKRYKLYHCFLQ